MPLPYVVTRMVMVRPLSPRVGLRREPIVVAVRAGRPEVTSQAARLAQSTGAPPGTRTPDPRIKSLSVASSEGFTGVRAAAQLGGAYSAELGRTVVNCNPNCNPGGWWARSPFRHERHPYRGRLSHATGCRGGAARRAAPSGSRAPAFRPPGDPDAAHPWWRHRRRLVDAIWTLMLFCDRPETPVTIFAGLREPYTTRILQMSS